MESQTFLKHERAINRELLRTMHVEPVGSNFLHLEGEIAGPPDTPYEGARFRLEIKVPSGYPYIPPKICFITKIWHPNVSSVSGATGFGLDKNQWIPGFTIQGALLHFQAMLCEPEPDDPVAEQFKKSYDQFYLTAQHWAHAYAGGTISNSELFDEKIRKLMQKCIGMSLWTARLTLSSCNWDVDRAVEEYEHENLIFRIVFLTTLAVILYCLINFIRQIF